MYDPDKLTLPKKKCGEHRKSNPFLRHTQNSFLKFILGAFSRIQMLFWKIKVRRMKSGNADQVNSTKTKRKTDKRFNINKFISRISKIPLLRRIFLIDVYNDFIQNEQKIQGIHGLHPHIHIKSQDAQGLATIYGSISLMDDCIGKILKQLENNGQEKDTVVIFTSDHGNHRGEHGLYHKGPFPYDDGQKVPFIVRIPSSKKKNKISTSYISLMDIAPTVLSLTG